MFIHWFQSSFNWFFGMFGRLENPDFMIVWEILDWITKASIVQNDRSASAGTRSSRFRNIENQANNNKRAINPETMLKLREFVSANERHKKDVRTVACLRAAAGVYGPANHWCSRKYCRNTGEQCEVLTKSAVQHYVQKHFNWPSSVGRYWQLPPMFLRKIFLVEKY